MSVDIKIEDVRDAVKDFAIAMEKKLRVNDYKKEWKDKDFSSVFVLLRTAYGESRLLEPESKAEKAVDIANFAMMIFDNEKDKQE